SVAWFELVVVEPSTNPGVHCAVPFAMDIQVGDGSWESSLIQSQATSESEEESKDFVSFDLVLVWDR
ncbi:MAG: hypothetical protein ACI8RD_012665, partial [Bacillariaceae sp.]